LTSIARERFSEPPRPGSPLVNQYPASTRPVRKQLDHSTHYSARFGATFFITICCEARVANQLCRENIAQVLFETGRCYHDTQKWYLKILLVMPDHLHMLVGIPGDANLSNLVRDFKRITAKMARIPIGSEIFSIIDCGTMKVRQKNLNTSAGTLCGQV
jgi:REP element-mobilizing transposase RayT